MSDHNDEHGAENDDGGDGAGADRAYQGKLVSFGRGHGRQYYDLQRPEHPLDVNARARVRVIHHDHDLDHSVSYCCKMYARSSEVVEAAMKKLKGIQSRQDFHSAQSYGALALFVLNPKREWSQSKERRSASGAEVYTNSTVALAVFLKFLRCCCLELLDASANAILDTLAEGWQWQADYAYPVDLHRHRLRPILVVLLLDLPLPTTVAESRAIRERKLGQYCTDA